MREIRSSGSVGERGGNEPLYPERIIYRVSRVPMFLMQKHRCCFTFCERIEKIRLGEIFPPVFEEGWPKYLGWGGGTITKEAVTLRSL